MTLLFDERPDGLQQHSLTQNAANAWNTVMGSTQINCLLMTSGEPADNNNASVQCICARQSNECACAPIGRALSANCKSCKKVE